MKIRTIAVWAAALALAGAAHAGESKDIGTPLEPELPTVTVEELSALIAEMRVTVVDANSQATRETSGTIPGALLAEKAFDPAHVLPADRETPLVFYCGGTKCGASRKLAREAVAAGYKNVRVLPDGIAGWVAAGKPVDRVAASVPAAAPAGGSSAKN